jgi:hypothetical protein
VFLGRICELLEFPSGLEEIKTYMTLRGYKNPLCGLISIPSGEISSAFSAEGFGMKDNK